MVLRLFNTMTRKKEVFEPIEKGKVRFYSCGQTVYSDMHIGNARAYASWDVLKRYLLYKGYDVFHVQNFTDVGHLVGDVDVGAEDKILKSAKEKKMQPMALVEKYIADFFKDIDDLNIMRADIYPRATGHILEMQEMIKVLLEKKHAYIVDGNVYYDITSFPKYNNLFGMNLLKSGGKARVEKDPNKRHIKDFALWIKATKGHIMRWPSPWSVGYPGWHIECSAMSIKYLGEHFDIHCGGKDHIYVHHPNEIAQSEGYTGKKWVNYWLHNEFLLINGEKMSKSKGNYYTAREAINEWGGEVVKMFLISSHYRTASNYTKKNLETAKKNLEKFYTTLNLIKNSEGGNKTNLKKEIEILKRKFEVAMDDDLNTPLALKEIYEFMKKVNKNLDNKKEILNKAKETILLLGRTLGLELKEKKKEIEIDPLIKIIIDLRSEFRKKKDYEKSDKIREKLLKLGIELKDEDEKTTYLIKKF